MKLEILTENLKKALNGCEKITRKVLTLPVLQNILIKTEGNFLELTTTNLESTIKWWVLSKIERKGVLAVPATFLANLVGLIVSEKIEIEAKNKTLVLKTENQNLEVHGQDAEDFPIIPKIEKNSPIQVNSQSLFRGLQQVIDIPSISQIRPEISGVYFFIKKDKLKLVGTDSFRLGEKSVGLVSASKKDESFIVPQTSIREVLNISSQEDCLVSIFCASGQVLFEFFSEELGHPKVHILSRLIEGEYPNYQDIIPKKYAVVARVNKSDFENQVKKAGLFSGKSLEVKLEISESGDKLGVFSQSADIGKYESFISCKAQAGGSSVSFNYKFLLDGLSYLKSSEVDIELSAGDGPGVLRPVGDASYLYILMPIKNN